MTRARRARAAAGISVWLLAACASTGVNLAAVPFAPALNVQLDAMSRKSSGVLLRDSVIGAGALASRGRQVVVHYTGWLPDGRVFETSHSDGKPVTFPLGTRRVIQGWDDGIAGMRVGGIRKLVIPPDLAYGDHGTDKVPPASVLIFNVELIDVR